jgi:putative component of membrane protein insertase Oxa1/YidC/SpoIIIJ protein YidD
MQISIFDSFSRRIGVTAITGYQRYISPHKGFRCAHRVLHGGESCSGYVKRQITENGLKTAFFRTKHRFKACKQANRILHAQTEDPESPGENAETEAQNPKKAPIRTPQNSPSFNTNYLDCANLSCTELLMLEPDCSLAECGLPDFAAVDCSSLDCGCLDCNVLDCGGCSF